MRVALLLGASPQKAKHGPFVKLGAGSWRVTGENIKDSTFMLTHLNSPEPSLIPIDNINNNYVILGDSVVKASWSNRGNEAFINLFAELI